MLFASASFAAPPSGPAVGPNVNMVQGTKWPQGDPFLTKQNEPSIAVSSRNARHLMAGSNDYRLVPVAIAEQLDDPEAWIQIYKSLDGGATWRSTPLGGCPLDVAECRGPGTSSAANTALGDPYGLTAKLKAYKPNFGADPTVRPGPYGTFFLTFIAGTRDTSANGVVAIQRFVDKNNDIQRVTDARSCDPSGTNPPPGCRALPSGGGAVYRPAEDPILPDVLNIIDVGTPGQGKDKPWVAADIGRRTWNAGKTCNLLSWTSGRTDVLPAQETNVGAFNVYVSYANFQGNSGQPDIYVVVSSDCGTTFGKPIKLTSGATKNQGTSSAIDPITGAVYIVWRQFANPSAIPPTPDAIMLSKSTDGGKTWNAGKVPTTVATFIPYDQGATAVSFRTLDFPSVAVSVDSTGQSRVHVAWGQRDVAPASTPPYACTNTNQPEKCDARIVIATSKNGGQSFGAPIKVDGNFANPIDALDPNGRGHQVQASLTFAAGKLLATWVDQRLDQTEGVLQCPAGNTCNSVSDLVEVRRAAKNSNLDTNCHFDVSKLPGWPGSYSSTQQTTLHGLLDNCNKPAAVWTTYITDGTPGLVRRHTVDLYSAMADPADTPVFASSRVSQYTFGNTAKGTRSVYDIVQKEVNAPNLPMFSKGQSAFIGDYIDSAGQLIVETANAPVNGKITYTYKFNAGVNGDFVTGIFAPAFHVAFTDNRDVIPPKNGNWSTPTCLTTAFDPNNPNKVISGSTQCLAWSPDGKTLVPTGLTSGVAGNRNQNIYTATLAGHSVAFAGANSKSLDTNNARSFVITVRNFSDSDRWYLLTPTQPAAGSATFRNTANSDSHVCTPTLVFVQRKSSAARNLFVTSSTSSDTANVKVESGTVAPPPSSRDRPDCRDFSADSTFTTNVVLNPDPSVPPVLNGDGGPASTDTALDNIGNVVLSNAVLTNNVLTNNVLSNNALSNNALSNNALTNAVLSNVMLSNAALSNDPLTNAALSNVVLSNVALSNNALTNIPLANVVLSNNTLNAALTNLDPANVALSNAVLSNNALTNYAYTNNALSNVVLTNNALTNAVLSNVVLSNAALSNNALSNNVLSNVALSNAPLGDETQGGDPDALKQIETGAVEIAQNSFKTNDLQSSSFKETTFTVRNRGNTDTILSIKLMLRDAVCSGAPNYTCTTPPGYKLQLVLRKVNLVPVAIPPTDTAFSNGRRDIQLGIGQVNTEVSNISDLPLIDPSDPNFGKFLPDDPKAAMLSLAAGEYAYATIRAIADANFNGTLPDPADLLRWGVRTVSSNSTTATSPFFILTQSIPAVIASGWDPSPVTAVDATFSTFGGKPAITASAVCTDKDGNLMQQGSGSPEGTRSGDDGSFYIRTDATARLVYGPKRGSGNAGWVYSDINGTSPQPQIGSAKQPPLDPQPGPKATIACPPSALTFQNFVADPSIDQKTNGHVLFTAPQFWGTFYMLASAADGSTPSIQRDRQVITTTVLPRPPVLTFTPPTDSTAANYPFVYNNNGYGIDLRPYTDSDSKNSASPAVPQPIVFSATGGACHMSGGTAGRYVDYMLFIDSATGNQSATCDVKVRQEGNETYAPAQQTKTIFIDRATQTIKVDSAPATLTYNNFGNTAAALVAHAESSTALNSGLGITFVSQDETKCKTTGTDGSGIQIVHAGDCVIWANQSSGNGNYKPVTNVVLPTITINKADQAIVNFVTPADDVKRFGDLQFAVTASVVTAPVGSPTAPNSNLAVTFSVPGGVTACSVTAAGMVTVNTSGNCSITASQLGDGPMGNYNPTSQTASFRIAKAKFYINATVSPTSFVYGDDLPPSPVSVTYGFTSTVSPTTALCFLGAASDVQFSGQPSVVPALAGTYTIIPSVASNKVSPYCDVFYANALLTVNRAPTEFVVEGPYFTPFTSPTATPTTITGKLHRTGVAAVYPTDAATVVLKKGTTTVATYSPVPGSPDGSFTITDASVASGDYTITFDYTPPIPPLASNFLAPTTKPTSTLRVEGFSAAEDMNLARAGHTSTLLADGNVLVTGGVFDGTGAPTATAEIYCAVVAGGCNASDVGTFKSTVGSMALPRFAHTATRLADGTVLIAGGAIDATFTPTASTEVYCAKKAGPLCILDADVGTFKTASTMLTTRAGHTATLLGNNTVLVVGGSDFANPPFDTSEVYCAAIGGPCTAADGSFQSSGTMTTPRDSHTATLLGDGTVLVTGGEIDALGTPTDTAEIYCATAPPVVSGSPCTAADGTFKPAGNLMSSARSVHTASLLVDGRVLVAGGYSGAAGNPPTASADVYCAVGAGNCAAPADLGKFKSVGPFAAARANQTAALLTDGWVVAAGGVGTASVVATSELFDPATNLFEVGALMGSARSGHAATRLPDGRILVTGGRNGSPGTVLKSAELYNGQP